MASMPAQRLALLALLLLAAAWRCVADDHDCIFGSPPECANSLAGDKACRGATATNNTAWISMDCDYVIYDVRAKKESSKWVVIHAADCDAWTGALGDWAARVLPSNLFGLRQCMGLDQSSCTLGRTTCKALHTSWSMPTQPKSMGLGFTPPEIIKAAKTPGNQLLFLHANDAIADGYKWAELCINGSGTAYVCIAGDDPAFDRKFYGTERSKGHPAHARGGAPGL